MSFPLLFTVGHRVHSTTGTDGWGEDTEGWADPVAKAVYGWGAPGSREPKLAGDDRIVVDVELLVPPEFECFPKDRIILDFDPNTWSKDDPENEVLGPVQRYDHNPFGWNPGGVVNLRHVTAR